MEPFAFHKEFGFSAKVRIISLHHLGYGEIAATNEDHIAKMGVVDSGTVGVADAFEHLATQAHVEGFFC